MSHTKYEEIERERARNMEAQRKETPIERYTRQFGKAPQYGPFGNYPNRIVGDGTIVVVGWR